MLRCAGLHTYNELIHSRSQQANVARRVADLMSEAVAWAATEPTDMGVACDELLTGHWLNGSTEESDSEYMGGDFMPPGATFRANNEAPCKFSCSWPNVFLPVSLGIELSSGIVSHDEFDLFKYKKTNAQQQQRNTRYLATVQVYIHIVVIALALDIHTLILVKISCESLYGLIFGIKK